MKLFLIEYLKNGTAKTYQIPATTEYNALVRLGQIYGDKEDQDDVEIVITSVRKV